MEDTNNLVGHALQKVMRVVADQQGRELAEVAQEAGAALVCSTSLKAALDRDWDQQLQKDEALALVLHVLQTVDAWVQQLPDQEDKAVADPLARTARTLSGPAQESFRSAPMRRRPQSACPDSFPVLFS